MLFVLMWEAIRHSNSGFASRTCTKIVRPKRDLTPAKILRRLATELTMNQSNLLRSSKLQRMMQKSFGCNFMLFLYRQLLYQQKGSYFKVFTSLRTTAVETTKLTNKIAFIAIYGNNADFTVGCIRISLKRLKHRPVYLSHDKSA